MDPLLAIGAILGAFLGGLLLGLALKSGKPKMRMRWVPAKPAKQESDHARQRPGSV